MRGCVLVFDVPRQRPSRRFAAGVLRLEHGAAMVGRGAAALYVRRPAIFVQDPVGGAACRRGGVLRTAIPAGGSSADFLPAARQYLVEPSAN